MKFQLGVVGGMASLAAALPGLAAMRESMLQEEMKREAAPEPQLGGLLGPLGGLIDGLLGSVTEGPLNPSDKRPEPGYEFIAPGPGDSRGPCPGLNTLANHGYLPRNGYVSGGQILEATSRGFNMGTDLAAVLVVFAVLADGSIEDESWWLGTDPKTGIGGLNRHSTVEADISVNREDFYTGCGDNHHLSSRLFTQNVEIVAKRPTKQFDIPAMAQHYAAISKFSEKYNPTIYYFPFPQIVSVVAFNFYPRFFANGTNEFGGKANYESISSIVGAKYDQKTGYFQYVPERFPENWYRRSFPYTAEVALLEGFTEIYPANPVLPPGFLQDPLTGAFNATNIFCEIYQGINSITPLALAGQEEIAAAKIGWALGLLDSAFNNTLLGCHRGTVSKNSFQLYPNASHLGGALNPPRYEQKNAGNNVYNKTYFKNAPTSPNCNPSA